MNQKEKFRSRLSIGKYVILFLAVLVTFGFLSLGMSGLEVFQVCALVIVEGIVFYHFLFEDEFDLIISNDELHIKKEFRTKKHFLNQINFVYENGKINIESDIMMSPDNPAGGWNRILSKDNFYDFDKLLLYLSERNLIAENKIQENLKLDGKLNQI